MTSYKVHCIFRSRFPWEANSSKSPQHSTSIQAERFTSTRPSSNFFQKPTTPKQSFKLLKTRHSEPPSRFATPQDNPDHWPYGRAHLDNDGHQISRTTHRQYISPYQLVQTNYVKQFCFFDIRNPKFHDTLVLV